jgi:hypothetical protein
VSEYVATEYEGTRPVNGGPGNAGDAPAKDKALQPAQAGNQAAGDVAGAADTAGQARSAGGACPEARYSWLTLHRTYR